MDEHGIERGFVRIRQPGEDHAADPERDDVISRDQRIGWVKIFKVLGLFRPSQRGERPQGAGKPGVQRVLVLAHGLAALGAHGERRGRNADLAAVIAVIGRDAVAPPELAADAPVARVLHPVVIGLVETLGHEPDTPVAHGLDGRARQRHHLHEPLLAHHGLHGGAAAVTGAHIVLVRLDGSQISAGFQVCHNGLARLVTVHARIFSAVLRHVRVVRQHLDDGQAVAHAHLEVVGVMRGSDLHHARAEFPVHIRVADNGDLLPHQRQNNLFAVQMGVAFVVRVHGDGRISQHGLGAGSGKLHEFIAARHRIFQMPEKAVLLLVLHLRVGDGRFAVGAPVDDALPPVDEAVVVQLFENLQNSLAAALVHGETLTLPVAGTAQLFQLLHDAPAVLLFPVPSALQKPVAAEVLLREALFLHLRHDLRLCGNGRMVRARHPQSGIALHALVADEDILPGLVHGVAHVQLPRDIGRRHHNGIGPFVRVALRVEIACIHPFFVMLVLHGRRVVNFLQFFHPCTPFGAECKQKCRPTQMCMGRHQDTAVPPKLPAACAASHLNALNAGQRERLLLFPAPAPKRQRSARPHRLPPAPALFHGRPGPACARGTAARSAERTLFHSIYL